MHTLAASLLYFLFEVCLLETSFRVVSLISRRENFTQCRASEVLLASILVSFIIGSTLALLFTFMQVNTKLSYLGSIVILLLAMYGFNIRLIGNDIRQQLKSLTMMETKVVAVLGLLLVVFIPIILSNIRPLRETDSLEYFNYIQSWFHNTSNPYVSFIPGYSGFWELTYLPSITITQSDAFLWWNSLKAIIAVVLALYAIGRHLGFGSVWCLVIASTGIALKPFWIGTSGLATIKNDMVISACFLTLSLAGLKLISKPINRFSSVLLTLSLVLLPEKYLGVMYASAGLILIFFFTSKKILTKKAKAALWSVISIVVFVATTGHYYIRNALVYGNPLYPIRISLFNRLIFPGTVNLTGTAIADHLLDTRMWSEFSKWSLIASPVFLIMIVLIFLVPFLSSTKFYRNRLLRQDENIDFGLRFISFFALMGWVIYFRAFYSAGAGQNDFDFLSGFTSFRYATGPFLLSELFLMYLLSRMGVNQKWLLAICGTLFVYRVLPLYGRDVMNGKYYPLLTVALLVLVFVFIAHATRESLKFRSFSFVTIVVVLFVLSPLIFEYNRTWWFPSWKPAWERCLHSSGSKIGLVQDQDALTYYICVAGDHFQNSVQWIDVRDIKESDLSHVEYLIRLQDPSKPNIDLSRNFAQMAMARNFYPETVTEYVVVARNIRQ